MTKIEKLEMARLRAREKGFTLVELAIVLVIIGLIIGGVLVGQDLIKAAEIRATVSQIEQYNAAVNTFRGRYQGIPGDIRNATNFFDAVAWPNLSNGNGNRLLESCATAQDADRTGPAAVANCDTTLTPAYVTVWGTAASVPDHTGETIQFWHHLSAAELVPGFFDGLHASAAAAAVTPGAESGTVNVSFPASKLDRNGIAAFGVVGKNYYQIGASGTALADALDILPSLTPEEAFNLDTKMDDGKPGTGSVIARASAASPSVPNADLDVADSDFTASATGTACINEVLTAPAVPPAVNVDAYIQAFRGSTYAVLNSNNACSIRLRMN